MTRLYFTFRLWPTLGAIAAVFLFVTLGQWQYGKAVRAETEAISRETQAANAPMPLPEAIASPEGFRHTKLKVTGQFMGDYQFYLDNRQQDGVPGYQVLTPFKPNGHERWILVNRGWRAWPQGKRGQPEESVPTGEWTLIGQVDIPSNKAFFMMSNAAGTDGRLHMKVDLKAFEAWSKYSVEPIVLQEISGPDDGLSRRWPVAEDRTLMHRGYAYQWWCMVLVTVLFYLYASLKKRPEAS